MELKQILREAFEADKTLSKLHGELGRLRSEGVDREILIAELNAYYDEVENEADQDLIGEAIDFFYGWCKPSSRID